MLVELVVRAHLDCLAAKAMAHVCEVSGPASAETLHFCLYFVAAHVLDRDEVWAEMLFCALASRK